MKEFILEKISLANKGLFVSSVEKIGLEEESFGDVLEGFLLS